MQPTNPNQPQAPQLLDPQALQAMMQQSMASGQGNQAQQTLNVLQMYKQLHSGGAGGQSSYGPPPAGMSQSEWNNQCERFAESVTGNHQTGKFPTAANALQYYAQNGQLNTDLSKAPPNSLIYYEPSAVNGGDGHVALNLGNGMTRGATTSNGIQNIPINGWGAKPVGFVIPK